jgi:hypothetical protein
MYLSVCCLVPFNPHQGKPHANHPPFNEALGLRSRGQRWPARGRASKRTAPPAGAHRCGGEVRCAFREKNSFFENGLRQGNGSANTDFLGGITRPDGAQRIPLCPSMSLKSRHIDFVELPRGNPPFSSRPVHDRTPTSPAEFYLGWVGDGAGAEWRGCRAIQAFEKRVSPACPSLSSIVQMPVSLAPGTLPPPRKPAPG